MTPPENPATPPGIPVPYPNTGMASDTTDGSKSVKISDKEVMLKNKSCFKTSVGDEAGCAAKKGLVSSKNKGKVYFIKWSMDVKIEGENVDRHLDMTTNNHGSPTANEAIPWSYLDRTAMMKGLKSCEEEQKAIDDNCPKDKNKQVKCPDDSAIFTGPTTAMKHRDLKAMEDYSVKIRKGKSKVTQCHRALRCALVPYSKDSKSLCCKPQTPEHLIPKSCLIGHISGYKEEGAPCMCAIGGKSDATHGLIGAERRNILNKKKIKYKAKCKFSDMQDAGARAANKVNPHCSVKCLKAQLKRGGHKGISPDADIVNEQENVHKDNSALARRLSNASK